jgi:hypothetical protein
MILKNGLSKVSNDTPIMPFFLPLEVGSTTGLSQLGKSEIRKARMAR